MRTSILIALLPFLAGGCILLDNDLNSGPPRAGTFFRGHGDDGEQEGGGEIVRQADTSIYFCAVRFDDDYVWQRDTAYGSVPYELLLFKDFEQILSIKSSEASCISPDHDTHHIIDGHLYTEYSNLTRTTIGRDGAVILDFSGREFLKGLMPHDGDIYTLTEKRDGNGFNFRKNGELLFTKSGGSVFGGMDDPSYGPTGALYFDRGDLTFCYWTGKGALRKYFRVRNGTEEEEITKFSGKEVTDCIMGTPGLAVMPSARLDVPSPTRVEAVTAVNLIAIDMARVSALLKTSLGVNKLYVSILQDAWEAHWEVERVVRECSARERYLWFLGRFPGMDAVVPARYIASFLGMTPVTLSRLRSTLREERGA